MFTHEPAGRTYHRALFYGSGCSEAVLTYVPQDVDGVVRAHMWIGVGQHSVDHRLRPSIFPIQGFPGSTHSLFPNAYSVVCFERHPILPPNQAIDTDGIGCRGIQWLGDILVVKHTGHDFHAYQSMSYDDKALVDALLTCLLHFAVL